MRHCLFGRRGQGQKRPVLSGHSVEFDPDRLRAVGYADTRPVVEVGGLDDADLAEARAKNRRVSLLIH